MCKTLRSIVIFLALAALLATPWIAQGQQRRQQRRVMRRRASARIVMEEPKQRISFIDAHVHLNDLEMQLRLMAEGPVKRAIICWGGNSTNDSVLEAARANPQQFIPFASISPERETYRKLWQNDADGLLDLLETLLGSSEFKGIGEISVVHFPSTTFPEANFDPLSAAMRGIMKAARRHGLPVLVHCEITRLARLTALLEEFPEVAFIWAHGGYTPYVIAERMLNGHANLVYELSARTWYEHPRSPEYSIFEDQRTVWPKWIALIEANPRRFVVGSDSSNRSYETDLQKIRSVQLFLEQLSEPARSLVAEGNITRILGLQDR